jgi:phosphoglucosamine mutase
MGAVKKVKRALFGTDGVRGRVGAPPMTPDVIVRLGYALGRSLAANDDAPTVLVGKDTRLSGYMVESALEAGLAAAGADVLLSGPLPTSAVAYLTQTLRLSAGVVISASHNPHSDNGIKIFGGDGAKLADREEAKIERTMARGALRFTRPPGRAKRLEDAGGRYIEFCKKAFPADLNLFGMKIVVDCAHGAAYHVAPPVFHELGAEVVPVGVSPDGMNINRNCGALSPQAARRAVLESGADLGVALDGDGDRVLMIDKNGALHDGDALLFILASHNKPAGVAGTVMSNPGLEAALAKRKIAFARAAVGDRYVAAELKKRGWIIGGEPSGHLLLLDKHNTGDGIISALCVLSALAQTKTPLAAFANGWRRWAEESRAIKVADRKRAANAPATKRALAKARRKLGASGRVILRPSGTEPLLRLTVQAESQSAARTAAVEISAALAAHRLL